MTDEHPNFLARLKQHHLYGVVVAYAVVVGFLIQLVSRAFPYFGWAGAVPAVIIVLLLGFPLVVVLAWLLIKPKDPAQSSTWQRRHWKLSATVTVMVIVLVVISGFYGLRYSARHAQVLAETSTAQGVAEAASAASAVSAAVTAVPAKSIAVLPFVNLSGDPQNEYFSDGITEEILNALAQIPDLKVAARTSAFAFKDKQEDLRKVGEILGVATVLEGSVQKAGDNVRITVQLVDTRSGYQLWSEKYDRKLTNIFAIEDEISRAIADKLRVPLVGGGGQQLIRSATSDPQAHALYLRAIADTARRGPALKDAVLLLQQATARDPDYANAWAALSQAQELLPWYGLGEWHGSLNDAEQSAKRALTLDPQSGEAHAALATVLRDRLEYAAAEREYRKALTLSPGSSEIHNQFAQLMSAVGASDAALQLERIAISLDPLAPTPRYHMGSVLLSLRRYPEAITEFGTVLEHTPDYVYARFLLASANLYAGYYDEARKIARAASVQAGQDPEILDELMRAYVNPALRHAALQHIAGLDRIGRLRGDFAQAYWYGLLGAREQAIMRLQHWVGHAPSGERLLGAIFLRMPAFDSLRDDPRFKAVLKTMGLPYTPSDASTL